MKDAQQIRVILVLERKAINLAMRKAMREANAERMRMLQDKREFVDRLLGQIG